MYASCKPRSLTLGTSHRADAARPRADVHDVWLLDPGDPEVRPLANRLIQNSTETVENNGALTAIHCAREATVLGSAILATKLRDLEA